jgi:hypothetical protein
MVKTMTKSIDIEILLFEKKWELLELINRSKLYVNFFIPGILKKDSRELLWDNANGNIIEHDDCFKLEEKIYIVAL